MTRAFESPPRQSETADKAGTAETQLPRVPATIRFCLITIYIVRTITVVGVLRACSQHLIRRPIIWTLNWYPKAYGFVTAVTSGRVDRDEYLERNYICATCPRRVTVGPTRVARLIMWFRRRAAAERHFCESCGCLQWLLAEIDNGHWWDKNWWRKHFCPARRHPRTDYADYITISPSGSLQRADVLQEDSEDGRDDT